MKLDFLDIGLLLLFLFYSYAVLEFIERREKYSILLFGNFILAFSVYTLLKIAFLKSIGLSFSGLTASIFLYVVLNVGSDKKENTSNKKYKSPPLVLGTKDKKSLRYYEPLENFLVYGGANAGKTASLGKPLLLEYLKQGYSAFVYDAKEFDYAKTIFSYYRTHNPPSKLYYANFNDANKSHRFNPIKPQLFANSSQFEEINEHFLKSLRGSQGEGGTWFDAALGLYKGISWVFFKHYPQWCTIPHITNFFLHRSTEDLLLFLQKDAKAMGYASSVFKGAKSENTIGSVLFSLANYLSKVANNETVCYILSGDDFDYNFVDPERPISFCLCNSHQISDTLSPIMGALVNISAKQYTLDNKNPVVYCLDEATTFHIPNFENLPSLLREFKVAFLMLTQSASKVEKLYGKLDLNSIHSNFTNKFFGKTGDVNAVKMYQQLFEMVMHEYKSESKNFGDRYSESETTSKRKEHKYEASFFSHLKPGEFVGLCGQSNYVDFHKEFVPYDRTQDMEPRMISTAYLSNSDLEAYHQSIVEEVKSLTV
ncbi:type IV secretory system conjugative DNA transfer family protein [Arenibacter sp. 6A1]|uniref:type IV secretory system conjugative DNA transfer family protein n=1 Tax=Arenibacter sp. 6A1 TaxID=2720391 RepID=UPI0014460509|nr:type IV secretory system conjugative DNA transfer family protein [Arenibacter sp. 6A1]NKI28212.1 type IV secretory system conjugative DNA transfer family protein [Arenibacter sp. 6A1]